VSARSTRTRRARDGSSGTSALEVGVRLRAYVFNQEIYKDNGDLLQRSRNGEPAAAGASGAVAAVEAAIGPGERVARPAALAVLDERVATSDVLQRGTEAPDENRARRMVNSSRSGFSYSWRSEVICATDSTRCTASRKTRRAFPRR